MLKESFGTKNQRLMQWKKKALSECESTLCSHCSWIEARKGWTWRERNGRQVTLRENFVSMEIERNHVINCPPKPKKAIEIAKY